MTAETTPQKENGFLNLIFNIIIPVLILNKLSKFIGPVNALILALLFPLGYGAYDLFQRKKTNALSVLGLLNVLLTGGLAVIGLGGIWFAIKEAAFPGLIGVFVFGSSFTKRPLIETIFLNPAMMKIDLLEQRLQEHGKQQEFHHHLKNTTRWFSLSFVFSSLANFFLARYIFTDIDPSLSGDAHSLALNEQIAKMTTWSMAIIMVPSMIFLLGVFWYLMRGVKKHAGLSMEELLNDDKK